MKYRWSSDWDQHHEVHAFEDHATGLHAIVAIHRDGPLGVAGGGCRMRAYGSEEEAVRDALRLSAAMSHKLALAGVAAGGGKCVVMGDPARDKSSPLLRALGRAVHSLQGRFVIGGDMGIGPDDLRVIAEETPYVELGSHGYDTISEATARGVRWALHAAVAHRMPKVSSNSLRVAIQGVGKVGGRLAELLAQDGVELTLSDVDRDRVTELANRLGAHVVAPERICDSEVDVLAPCAMGDVIDEVSVERLRCAIVAGSANNQLADDDLAEVLHAKGIVYVPDFVASMGGALAGAKPHACVTPQAASELTERVGDVTKSVLEDAERQKVSPLRAAVSLARLREKEQDARRRQFPRALGLAAFQVLWRQPAFAHRALQVRALVERVEGRVIARRASRAGVEPAALA